MKNVITATKELISKKDNIIIVLFLISLFVAHFPKGISYHLFTSSIPALMWITILSEQKYRAELIVVCNQKKNRIVFVCIALFLFIGGISLSYSTNIAYGQYKLLGMMFDTFPAVMAFYLIMQKLSSRTLNLITNLFLLSGIIFTAILYCKSNLLYLGSQKIFMEWSHVGFGKFLGYASLFSLFNSYKQRSISSYLITLFILSGLLLSGLRAPIIFVVPVFIISGVFVLHKSTLSHKRIVIAATSIVFFIIALVFINYFKPELERRAANSLETDLAHSKDGSLKGRYLALLDAVEMIKEKPIAGWGLGGFNITYKGFDHSRYYWYPHNMLAEISVELGIPTLLVFIFCMTFLFYILFKINFSLGIFFSLALWNALFTGDISYQKVLFIGIAFLLLDQQAKDNVAVVVKA